MEELNLTYEIKTYKRNPNGVAPLELQQIHPLGKSPIVSIHPPQALKPLVLAESAPIMEYFLDFFGGARLVPKRFASGKENQIAGETEAWMRYRYFMHYVEGRLMSPLQVQLIMNGNVHAMSISPIRIFGS